MSVTGNRKQAVTIRNMRPTDLAVVMRLEAEIFTDPWPESAFIDIFEGEGWHAWVAETDTAIIAYACMLIVADEGHLANIAVVPQHRRKSVAKRLLNRILTVAVDADCGHLILEVRVSNKEAIAFYERAGFETLYRRPKYYQNPAEDALVMVKYLKRPEPGN